MCSMRDSIVVRSFRRNRAGLHYARVFLQELQVQPMRNWCSQHGVLVADSEGTDFRMRTWGCSVFFLIFPTPKHLVLFKLSWNYRMDDERSLV